MKSKKTTKKPKFNFATCSVARFSPQNCYVSAASYSQSEILLIKNGKNESGEPIYRIGEKNGFTVEIVKLQGTQSKLREIAENILDII